MELALVRTKSVNKKDVNYCWKDTKSWLKSLLKTLKSDDLLSMLMLYNHYALIENEQNGNVDNESGRKVLLMLLTTYSSNPLTEDKYSTEVKAALIHTWIAYAHHILLHNGKTEALDILVALGAGSSFSLKPVCQSSPAMLLKAKKKFETLLVNLTQQSPSTSNTIPFIGLFHIPDATAKILASYSYFLSLTEGQKSAEQAVQNWLRVSKREEFNHFDEHNSSMRFNADFLRQKYSFTSNFFRQTSYNALFLHYQPILGITVGENRPT